MKIIVITHEEFFDKELVLLEEMSRRPVFRIHFRKPGAARESVEHFLARCSQTLKQKLILHDWYELVVSCSLNGYYFRYKELFDFSHFAENKNVKKCFTTGIHEPEELQKLPDWMSYAWISPVFPSISKKGYRKNWNPEMLKHVINSSKIPLFALGGIDASRIHEAAELGFPGVVVKGTLWSAPDPLQQLDIILKEAGY